MFEGLGILIGARGFMGGDLREPGDTLGLFIMGFRQGANFGLELAEQLEQLALAVLVPGLRAADLRLNFANRFFNHGFCAKVNRCREFGKSAIMRLALDVISLLEDFK